MATPHVLRFPQTEVGAVSPPLAVSLVNQGSEPVDIESLGVVLFAGVGEPAYPGEFELVHGKAGPLPPAATMTVELVFRPTRVVGQIGAHLRATGRGAHDVVDVILKASPAPPRADHADRNELTVATHAARQLEVTVAPSVQRYADMLTVLLAAQRLTDQARPEDAAAHAQIAKLLEPVEQRLNQLNDHRGRLAQLGAGNIAGQASLDMAETAVRSWRQRLALGAMIRTDELVTRFRTGAEVIRFLTGEHADAPVLREFDHVSRVVGVGAAMPVLAPVLGALAVEEAPLLAFAGRVAARRVVLWALTHPAAALAASEALIGFGVQIGEDGWEPFWDQLRDPKGRWFVIAQVLMDYMHVRNAMSGHDAAPVPSRQTSTPDTEGARQRLAQLRSTLQQVHDAAGLEPTERSGGTRATVKPVEPPAPGRPNDAQHGRLTAHAARDPAAGDHEPQVHAPGQPATADPAAAAANQDLRSQLPAELSGVAVNRSAQLRGNDVVVNYRDGAVHIDVGPTATARHISYHIAAARSLLRFKGPLGYVRQLADSVRSKLRLTPGYGSAGFEARAEVTKLLEIEHKLTALKARLEAGAHVVEQSRTLNPAAIDGELAQVQEQLELEATRLDSYEPGKGFVAARALPEYPIALDSVVATEDDHGGTRFSVSFRARTKDGVAIDLGEGYVKLTPDGHPDGQPEFMLSNYTHVQGVEHKVKLYSAVIEQGPGALLLGQGEDTPVTRYAIERFIQRYKSRFGAAPLALGGWLAFENKKNFQVQYIKFTRQGFDRESALTAAANEISYGKHRVAAGYSSLGVDPGPLDTWTTMDLGDGKGSMKVPANIQITARQP